MPTDIPRQDITRQPDATAPLLVQAPMEGVIDHHVRKLLSEVSGIDQCVTEFLRITHTKLPQRVFLRICPELANNARTANGTPVKLQLLGGNPENIAYHAAKAVEFGAQSIDLNFGCPAKSVNNSDGGACLLREPHRVESIVDAVRKALPDQIPLSAKIRLGYEDRSSYLDNAMAAQNGGADTLAVHARSKVDGYKPPAYWEYIGEIREKTSMRVIANGDIWTLKDFIRCREVTGCDAFMFGRSLLATPDLPNQVRAYCTGQAYSPMPWSQVAALLWEYYLVTKADYPAKHLGNRIKQWLVYLSQTYPQARTFFDELKRRRSADEIEAAFAPQLATAA
ncbi:tRNA dihydrouridine(16) synthase DusC [Biformimicrobium ophioploci]|uniref:tRNA-dihydrouridine(16) synthase n=2 Tax=Biformimicrobium ophioploci TaxID=3036711 RepID=A0ABQ6LXZ4_9GAMM|nr:tRNA dihydrouridine(16) synthase DusC [Microbulbifer sp. NKW57]